MKNKLFILILVSMFLLISSLSNVKSFMPPTHNFLNSEIMSSYQGTSTQMYNAMVNHPDLAYVGNMLTDISVVFYYTGGGAKYQVTHSPGFCTAMLSNAVGSNGVSQEEEFSCAVGTCLHQSEDWVSHTIMVPYAITHSGLANQVVHVFAEQHLDNIVLKEHPEVVNNVMSINISSWNKCIPLFKRTLDTYDSYKQDVESGATDTLINSFIAEVYNSVNSNSKTSYDMAFQDKVTIFGKIGLVPPLFLLMYLGFMGLFGLLAVLLIFKKDKKIINWISLVLFTILFVIMLILFISLLTGHLFQTVVFIVRPISNLVPIGSANNILNLGIQSGQSLLTEGASYLASADHPKIASGFVELSKASNSVKWIDYIIIFLLFATLIFLIYINFRKNPQSKEVNWRYN
jgi:hypothetical protein